MTGNHSYIKSVEEYFLKHACKGIMLSSVDYEIINKWQKREIPLEVVLSGIRDAFSESKNSDYHTIKSLKSISGFVENKISINLVFNDKMEEPVNSDLSSIKIYFDKINRDIERCNNIRVKDCLIKFKDNISSMKNDIESNQLELFTAENELLDEIYNCLEDEEKIDLNNKIEKLLQDYSHRFTEKAYKKSYKSHRNGLLKKRFNLNIFD